MTEQFTAQVDAFKSKSTLGKAWTAVRTVWWLSSRAAWYGGLATVADTALSYLWFASGAWMGALIWGLAGLWSLRNANRARRVEGGGRRALGFLALALVAGLVAWLHWKGVIDWGGWLRGVIETQLEGIQA